MAGVLVRVPYIYKATVRRPRKRNDEVVGYLGHVDLRIPEVGQGDAPVVLHGVAGSGRDIPPHRFHDETLWVPETEGRDGKGPSRTAEWLHGDPGRDVSYHPLFRKSAGYSEHRMGAAVPRDRDANVKEVVSDDEAEVVAEVRSVAGRFLMVGDEVWRRTAEPVYDLSRHLFGNDHVTLGAADGGRDQYRLDQGHWIPEVDWSRSGRESGLTRPEVVILRPDLLRARTTEHSVAWTCGHMVNSLFERMKEGTVADFEVYARLRDGTRELGTALERGGRVDLPALAALLTDAIETCARLDVAGHGVDYDRKYVDNALGRIERELAAPVQDDVAGFTP